MRALIGNTGFVGSNLAQNGHYDVFFNSKNSQQMRGMEFCEVVCAGVSAVKWQANKEPVVDLEAISSLMTNLREVKAMRFILISTVDVYQPASAVDEDDSPSHCGAPYGLHRAMLERFVIENFVDSVILRLPALYGPGLKKNAIFDLCNDKDVDKIDAAARYQWYDVGRLEKDMDSIVKAGLNLVNITSEPIEMSVIGDEFFPGKLKSVNSMSESVIYDMRTKHANVLGGHGRYHFDRKAVLKGIGDYLEGFK